MVGGSAGKINMDITKVSKGTQFKSGADAVEKGRRGGIQNGINYRARKTLAEELLTLLAENNTQEKISVAIITKALKGDVKAFETIRDTIGEKPKDTIAVDQDKPFEVKIETI